MDPERQIAAVVAHRMPSQPYRLFLFGSRAVGGATVRSDYDVGIWADHPIDLAVLSGIRGDLEDLPILQKVDLVDLGNVSPSFREAVLTTGRPLNDR